MRSVFQWLLRLFMGAVVIAALGLAFVYYFASRSLPDYNADYSVDGLSNDTEIVRDNANVPHIFGPTAEDVYFGLGFAHAQDRLWQMTVMRRTAQGRLSELFGERTLKVDELLRRFDFYTLATKSLSVQDDETRAALDAYAKGVNAWIKTVNDEALGRGAPEFFLFPPEIAYWRPADSLAIVKLMGLQLSGHLSEEVLRAQTSLLVGEEGLKDILPDDPSDAVAALPDFAALFPSTPKNFKIAKAETDFLNPVPTRRMAGASNSWAAMPQRSAAGGTLLANDPHLGFTAPAIWYLARLELPTGGIIGATIPGMPVVLVGRGQQVGWAITSSHLDDQDAFIEKLNPSNPKEYLTPDGYKPFETRRTIINVKDGSPVTITLRWTENGPVIPGSQYDLGLITPKGHVASLAWTTLSAQDTSLMAGLKLMQAQSAEQALDVMSRTFVAPSQNLTVVDNDTIAMRVIGALPKRHQDHQTQGRMPAPGWIATNRWQGMLPTSDAPSVRNPNSGILGNTNNKMTDRPYPNHISFSWGDTQRVHRWKGLMQGREVHTRDSFIEAQLDTVSYTARSLLPLVAGELWYTGEAAPEGTPEARRQQALKMLADWNGEMNEHLPEPLIYSAWMRRLQDKLIRDDLGPLADKYTHVEPVFIERVFRDISGASRWCDIKQSTAKETCSDMARIALDEALLWIDQTHGGNLEALHWGDAHEAHHDHAVLGDLPLLRNIVNIRQSTSGGDNTLMRGLTSGEDPAPFTNVHGAGYRGVYDFADPDSSVFVISTGQSGHPLSRHYDDLGELWRRGEYIPMSLDPELARAAAVGITMLRPN
ncbi:penicillin acylase family protein [Actibacterium pelagium]|uniref:Penicillin acylase n=1 Tax=Actibacterium pelagium TaxID=2029103 RepID=A0A917AD58_9RHOB|nr:penicillin acylase family protein [Actibacterium pelagium]GGE42862.1 penicillin acylase [Actibacterium pelagium]